MKKFKFRLQRILDIRTVQEKVKFTALGQERIKLDSEKHKLDLFKKESDSCIFNGPAKLTKQLKVDKFFNGLPVYIKKYGFWIDGRSNNLKPAQIIRTVRIGIDYAGEYKDKKWRFILSS